MEEGRVRRNKKPDDEGEKVRGDLLKGHKHGVRNANGISIAEGHQRGRCRDHGLSSVDRCHINDDNNKVELGEVHSPTDHQEV